MKDRAVRRAHTERVIRKRMRLLKVKSGNIRDVNGKTQYDYVEEKPHTVAKQHPMDCGNSDCYLCHSEKLLDTTPISMFKKFMSAEEQIKEIE